LRLIRLKDTPSSKKRKIFFTGLSAARLGVTADYGNVLNGNGYIRGRDEQRGEKEYLRTELEKYYVG